MRIVTYEDREYDTIGLKLLLLSLRKHCSQIPVDVVFPSAPASLVKWISTFPNVSLHTGTSLKRVGYNVKPSVIAQALDGESGEVIWIDTDIIVTRDFQRLFADLPTQYFAVTEEWFGAPYQGGSYRSRAWGLDVGRQLKSTTNSAIVRATSHHRELLAAWDKLLEDEQYIQAQQKPWYERLVHLQSDQEVLCALLESTRFAHIPIHFLKRGRDIAHCFQHQGYAAHQMIANLIGGNQPYFVHGQGAKPWRNDDTFRYFLDVSTYTLCAAEYQAALEENTDWLLPKTHSAKIMRRIFRNNPWLTGLPLALYQEAINQRLLKTTIKQVLGRP
jgi:lipopolysaccharide biosynthesis glycosyltransferase